MFKYSPRCLKILLSYSNHRIETAFSRPFSHPFHKNTEENETVRESPIWGGGGSNTIRINLTIEGGSHVSEKFFQSFVPGNERHRSKEIPSPPPCFSLLLNSSGQGRDWKERENGNFHSKANSAFSFGGEGGNRLDVYRSRFFDSKPVPFPGRNVSTEPISEWLMRVSRVNGVYRWTSWWNARVKC